MFFYCNDEFNQLFKGSWYHVSTIKKFYDRIFSTLDKNPRIKYIEDSNNYDDIFQIIYQLLINYLLFFQIFLLFEFYLLFNNLYIIRSNWYHNVK